MILHFQMLLQLVLLAIPIHVANLMYVMFVVMTIVGATTLKVPLIGKAIKLSTRCL